MLLFYANQSHKKHVIKSWVSNISVWKPTCLGIHSEHSAANVAIHGNNRVKKTTIFVLIQRRDLGNGTPDGYILRNCSLI